MSGIPRIGQEEPALGTTDCTVPVASIVSGGRGVAEFVVKSRLV